MPADHRRRLPAFQVAVFQVALFQVAPSNLVAGDHRLMLDWPLLDGRPEALLTALGVIGLAFLLIPSSRSGNNRRWWAIRVPISICVGVLTAVVVKLVVDAVWQPFPEDPLPAVVLVAAGMLGAAVALAAGKPVRWPTRLACVLAVLCVGVSGSAAINQFYGQYPTLRAVVGAEPDNQVDFTAGFVAADQLVSAPAGAALSTVWTAPAGMPQSGSLAEVTIPGSSSGFDARSAWLYLPPAYLTTPRAELPVVVMMAGQPGSPRDWVDGGRLDDILDEYAAQHQGLAPVVLIVDNIGNSFDNPACVDSPRGNAFSYLTVDVPNWIKDNLQVIPDTKQWAVGGLSSGGTCALALAVNAPAIYRSFVDISGEDEITIGDPARTLTELFGGSQQKANAVQPLIVMKTRSFPDTAGFVVAGSDDNTYLPQAKRVAAAGTAAGMTIEYAELPGGHEWRVWGQGLEKALPWLAKRMGIVP